MSRVSGPLLDRIDIHIDVPAVKFEELTGKSRQTFYRLRQQLGNLKPAKKDTPKPETQPQEEFPTES